MSKLNSWILAAVAVVGLTAAANAQTVTKYVPYQAGNAISYGILDGDTIRELQGSIFESAKPTGRTRKLVGRHNGKVVQETNTNLLIFSIPYIVSYVSRYVTLEPGDVIFTGTPGTTHAMKPGDTFEVEVEGVGVLRNRIVAAGQGSSTGQ